MSGLTLKYQLPDALRKQRKAQPSFFDPQLDQLSEDVSFEANTWGVQVINLSGASQAWPLTTLELDSDADEAMLGWANAYSAALSQAPDVILPISHAPNLYMLNCARSSLVSEAEECRHLLRQVFTNYLEYDLPELRHLRMVGVPSVGTQKESSILAIKQRMSLLRAEAEEEGITIDNSSVSNLNTFLDQLQFSIEPLVFLMDGGTFRLVWRNEKDQVALEFLSNSKIRYVFFAERQQPVHEAKSVGIDDASHIAAQIKVMGLSHLIEHERGAD